MSRVKSGNWKRRLLKAEIFKTIDMADLNQLQEMVEEALRIRLADWEKAEPARLYQPVVYALEGGGKRLRPLMVMLGYRLFGERCEEALPAALAIEVFHNFTLLHDDIMDKAELRRNRPTVHLRFSENGAILSGDVMAFLAYRLLLETRHERLPEIAELFTQTAVEICEGQQLDMDFEERREVTTPEYLEMIRLKTAVLLACALKTGALLGGASAPQAHLLYEAGISLGLAFQLRDDLLDTFGEEQTFGKKIGGDIAANKKTILVTEALRTARADQKKDLENLMTGFSISPENKFREVRALFEILGVRETTLGLIDKYHARALELLEALDTPQERKQPLIDLSHKLILRKN